MRDHASEVRVEEAQAGSRRCCRQRLVRPDRPDRRASVDRPKLSDLRGSGAGCYGDMREFVEGLRDEW